MKKVLILLIILFLVTPLFAETYTETNIKEDLKLSLTIANVVYFGVTDQAINSSIVPTNNYSEVNLTFDPDTHTYRMKTMYFYVLSFVESSVKVTLATTKLKLNSKNATTLNYTATVTNTILRNAADGTTAFSGAVTAGNTYILVSEPATTSHTEPRVMGWRFDLALSDTAQSFELTSTDYYSATFTMTVSSV